MPTTSASHDSGETNAVEQPTGLRVGLPHLLLLIVLLVSGCDKPRFQGPASDSTGRVSQEGRRWARSTNVPGPADDPLRRVDRVPMG